jgi:hypothetical protein
MKRNTLQVFEMRWNSQEKFWDGDVTDPPPPRVTHKVPQVDGIAGQARYRAKPSMTYANC